MKKSTLKYTLLISSLFFPATSFAALEGLKTLIADFRGIIEQQVWYLVISLTFIYFFWGVGQSILHSGDQKAREEGKQKMIWGVIALFLVITIYGVLYFIGDLIGVHPASGLDV